jgi:hypothetical protein
MSIDYRVLATSQQYRDVVEFWRSRLSAAEGVSHICAVPVEGVSAHRDILRVGLSEESARVLSELSGDPLGRFTVASASLALLLMKYFNCRPAVLRTPLLADPLGPNLNGESGVPLVIEARHETTRCHRTELFIPEFSHRDSSWQ